MEGNIFKGVVKRIFTMARNKCPNITNDTLFADGSIYYMNGKQDTMLTWNTHGKLCEFVSYHQNKEPFINVSVCKSNVAEVSIFENSAENPTHRYIESIKDINVNSFANLMNYIAEGNENIDASIDAMDWDINAEDCYDISDKK